MSDRVVVLSEGRVTGEFDPDRDSHETVAAAAVSRTSKKKTGHTSTRTTSALHYLSRFREASLFIFILVLIGFMALARPDEYRNLSGLSRNLVGILGSAALSTIMAQGAMLVICSGGIDISVGSMMGLLSAIAGFVVLRITPAQSSQTHAWMAATGCLFLAISSGALLGVLNGSASRLARIHPIIITLAGLGIYRGLMLMVIRAHGGEIQELPGAYRALADGNLLGIPKICWYAVAITIIVHVFLRYTLTGRRVLALGNSDSAARLIGLSKTRLTLLVFGVAGALAGLTAVLNAGYYGKVQGNTGEGWELQAIAAAVIGGTNIMGGRGSALGTLLGAFLVAMVYNNLVQLRLSSYWQGFFVGGLILLAISADMLMHRLQGEKA